MWRRHGSDRNEFGAFQHCFFGFSPVLWQSCRMAEDASRDEVELVIVTMTFDAADMGSLVAILSKYVVLTRMETGCRNVDMIVSDTRPNRIKIIEKWDGPTAQEAHFNGGTMVEMARSCTGVLAAPPDIGLWQSMSAHDLT